MENLRQLLIVIFKLKELVKNVDMKQLLQKGKNHKKYSLVKQKKNMEKKLMIIQKLIIKIIQRKLKLYVKFMIYLNKKQEIICVVTDV